MSEILGKTEDTGPDTAGTGDVALVPGRRKLNTPLVPEGGSTGDADTQPAELGGDSVVEQIGEAIFRDTDERLDTPGGQEDLASDIDGLTEGERNDDEHAAIVRTIEELAETGALDVEVIATEAGSAETIRTDDGTEIDVTLGATEGARLIEVAPDDYVLLVSDEPDAAGVVEEAVEAAAQLITDVAEGQGVVVDGVGLRRALAYRSEALIRAKFDQDIFTSFIDGYNRRLDTRVGYDGPL